MINNKKLTLFSYQPNNIIKDLSYKTSYYKNKNFSPEKDIQMKPLLCNQIVIHPLGLGARNLFCTSVH